MRIASDGQDRHQAGRLIALCLVFMLSSPLVGAQPAPAGHGPDESATAAPESVPVPESLSRYVEFSDGPGPGGRTGRSVRPWTADEKQKVLECLTVARQQAPGLLVRAAAYGRIGLYRAQGCEHVTASACAMFKSSRQKPEILFFDRFFFPSYYYQVRPNVTNRVWATVHELAHLADVGGKIAASRRWASLTGKLIEQAHFLSCEQLWVSDQLCRDKGVPTAYATRNLTEALAEFATAIAFHHEAKINPQVISFVKEKLFALPYDPDPSIPLAMGAFKLMKQGKLEAAREAFDQALKIDPDYADAYWGRQLLEIRISERNKANANPQLN